MSYAHKTILDNKLKELKKQIDSWGIKLSNYHMREKDYNDLVEWANKKK
jgi:ribonuclease HIII